MATLNQVSTGSGGTWSANIVGYDTDSTTRATPTISSTSTITSNPYLIFNCSDALPAGATVTAVSATVKMCARSSSYAAYARLYNGTTALCNQVSTTSTSTSNTVTLTANSISDTFNNLRIYFGCSSTSTNRRPYVYGAHVTLTYTEASKKNVTITLSGDGTIDPIAGTHQVSQGTNLTVTIYPTNESATVTGKLDGTNITLTKETPSPGGTISSVIKTYTKYSGNFSSNEAVFQNAVNNGYDTSQKQTSNGYSSSGNTVTVKYTFDLSSIPQNAIITNVRCRVRGHAESSSNSNEHCDCQLYCGTTAKGSMNSFKSTGTTQTTLDLTTGTWTRNEIDDLWLSVIVGYYGGAVDGATVEVTYTTPQITCYTYTLTNITADHTITIVIGSSGPIIYLKINGSWRQVTAYKKQSGAWTSSFDLTTLDPNKTWIKR